jgi:hypothetical protein
MTSAAETYAARVDAVNAQRARLMKGSPQADRWDTLAARFTMDPRRPLTPNHALIGSYVQADDVIVDVGGGGGRISLPFANRCREVIDVDPSAGMGAGFEQSAKEAGIGNARFVHADWMAAEGISGDLSLVCNVTYFVRDIVPFVQKLEAASRRRVLITVWSVPPPSQDVKLFELVYGERQERLPSHRELLPVLWELGILPDVRPMSDEFRFGDGLPKTREEAVRSAAERLELAGVPEIHGKIEQHFDELFTHTEHGYRPLWCPDVREMIITWEPAHAHWAQ